jgi:hypothetical protein
MIQVHKDVLEYLEIGHTFLTGPQNGFCTLLEIGTGGKWIIAVGGAWEAGQAVLNVKYRGTYLEWPVVISKRDNFSYFLEIQGGDFKQSPLFERVTSLERDETLWNARKESRFTVGADLSEALGLRKAEQKALLGGKEQPCMVIDVSFGGMKIISFDTGDVRRGDGAGVALDFTDPIERIVLKGVIRSVIVKSGERGGAEGRPVRFAVVSLEFSETPLAFKRRLGAFMGKAGGKG